MLEAATLASACWRTPTAPTTTSAPKKSSSTAAMSILLRDVRRIGRGLRVGAACTEGCTGKEATGRGAGASGKAGTGLALYADRGGADSGACLPAGALTGIDLSVCVNVEGAGSGLNACIRGALRPGGLVREERCEGAAGLC